MTRIYVDKKKRELVKDTNKNLCINCKYHSVNLGAWNILCTHPKLNTEKGTAVENIRGSFATQFQEEMVRKVYSELCEQKGNWFEKITEQDEFENLNKFTFSEKEPEIGSLIVLEFEDNSKTEIKYKGHNKQTQVAVHWSYQI